MIGHVTLFVAALVTAAIAALGFAPSTSSDAGRPRAAARSVPGRAVTAQPSSLTAGSGRTRPYPAKQAR